MENKANSSSPGKTNSTQRILIIVTVVLLCLALCCCILVIAGILLFRPAGVERVLAPGQPDIPPPTGILNFEADPLYGFADLQRGFKPDPHIIGMGGVFDTSVMNIVCGFTTGTPAFAFNLSGGASEGFLRIYFLPSGATSDSGINIGLIVHTPDQEWLCEYAPTSGSGTAPLIDIEFAASGKYAVWVGLDHSGDSEPGMLYITESSSNTP